MQQLYKMVLEQEVSNIINAMYLNLNVDTCVMLYHVPTKKVILISDLITNFLRIIRRTLVGDFLSVLISSKASSIFVIVLRFPIFLYFYTTMFH